MRTALRYKMDISKQLCTVMLGNTKQCMLLIYVKLLIDFL